MKVIDAGVQGAIESKEYGNENNKCENIILKVTLKRMLQTRFD
jgi:hypothetical protein